MQKNLPYYVTLTGSKNNAGDHLIKQRAFKLLRYLRPDREILDLNGWEPLSKNNIETINEAKCLILLGGPALQKFMRPNVYALVHDLSLIKAPIVTMGIGWHSHKGTWAHTHNYELNAPTIELLRRVNDSEFISSVRDYYTLNVLASKGLNNFVMTGCPALYSMEHFTSSIEVPSDLKKIAFSLGVSLKDSNRMFRQMQNTVSVLRDEMHSECILEVVFHHSLNDSYIISHGAAKRLYEQQRRFASWLEKVGISYVDISGSAEKLVEYYQNVDLHIGYRVHAHIFMNSISKPSILLCEDGRGIALTDVIGGAALKSYDRSSFNKYISALNRLKIRYDNFRPNRWLESDLLRLLKYELKYGIRLTEPRGRINSLYGLMEQFVCQLP